MSRKEIFWWCAVVGMLVAAWSVERVWGEEREFYVGSSMTFASYMMDRGYVYKENGQAKDPFASLAEHGANIVRLEHKFGPYENQYTPAGQPADWARWERVKADAIHARRLGLEVFLTFTFNSVAPAKPVPVHNTVPDEWAGISDDQELARRVHDFVYEKLKELAEAGVFPAFVSIGNETNTHFLAPLVEKPPFDPKRNALLMGAGLRAVREIRQEYRRRIRTAVHIFSPEHVRWWLEQHIPAGLTEFDVLALSYYPTWHKMGPWRDFGELVAWLKGTYGKDLFILETAASWKSQEEGQFDKKVNIYTWPEASAERGLSPAVQKEALAELAEKAIRGGVLGVVVWGGDHVASDWIVVYPDRWGPYGSSWENNAFWDGEGNLHEGVNWMRLVRERLAGRSTGQEKSSRAEREEKGSP